MERLNVIETGYPGQYRIENNFGGLEDWDRQYLNFSGYFGVHGPHLFAAAPELCAALEAVLDGTAWAHIDADALRDALAALELAKGLRR